MMILFNQILYLIFKGILASNARKYRIGVYGTRNVCNKLHDNSDLKINRFFVSDAS